MEKLENLGHTFTILRKEKKSAPQMENQKPACCHTAAVNFP